MAGKWTPDNKGGTGGTITLDATKSVTFEGLNEYQIEQVRKIMYEELDKVIRKLVEEGVIK